MVDAKDQGQKAPPWQTRKDQPPHREPPATPPEAEAVGLEPGADAPGAGESGGAGTVDAVETAEGPALAERLAEAEKEIAKVKDEFLRALAEAENVRRRAARDKLDASKYAISSFARDLLPVADNLRRAADSVDAEARTRDPALGALVTGVEMTEKELLGVLERHGITPIAAEGQRFDPHVHEAMYEVPDESVPHGTVVQVLERGFMIHERPLRPSRVGVSRGGPRERPPEAPKMQDGALDPEGEPFAAGGAAAYEKKGDQEGGSAGSRYDEKL
jgi:molecular chaperone GrpE